VEENVIWAGGRLLSPAVVRSYITSAITRWDVKLGGKSTNALGRQYAFTKNLEVVAVIKKDNFVRELVEALKKAPITCGDSESIATIEDIKSFLKTDEIKAEKEVETSFSVPFNPQKVEIIEGFGRLYLVHERCKKKRKEFPLVNYVFPLKEENGILFPTVFTIRVKQPVSILRIESIGNVIKAI
jgi:hypothetical protein